MALASPRLTEIGDRFLTSMNARNYASAAELYATDATYESPSLLQGGHAGRIVGREQIMRYFIDALRTNEAGLIVEHLEVSPKQSPIDFLTARTTP